MIIELELDICGIYHPYWENPCIEKGEHDFHVDEEGHEWRGHNE